MHFNGQEVGRSKLLRTSKISIEMEELKKRFSKEIQEANIEPQFYISEFPSALNKFESLSSNAKDRVRSTDI